ncbi:phytoene desaturase family protein [Herbiconiux sp. UC225_62]|uniref:phytoene desaturase family protein n=1 Tax=Herbiconiux sp. UC225_62 TaxID=3350168 RepID=UPI0036D246C4
MVDVAIVGSGPNGLAAAVVMARAGLSVEIFEKNTTIGGGARTLELTLPGFKHDVGAAIHPMGLGSPFFRAFELTKRVEFAIPEVSYVHPLDGSAAAVAFKDLGRTASELGRDGVAWRNLFSPLVEHIDGLTDFALSQLLRFPRDPMTAVRFGLRVLEQGSPAWNLRFRSPAASALLSGVSAHSIGRMPTLAVAGAGLVLAAHAHARGWPVAVGGSQAIVDAMAADVVDHGGLIHTAVEIEDVRQLTRSAVAMFDVSARSLAHIASAVLPDRYARDLLRFKYGNGVAKVDFALASPVPWSNAHAHETATLHLGGTRRQIAHSESEVARGIVPSNPYVLVAQPSLFDRSRAPHGQHTLWAYMHVPAGSNFDPVEAITNQIERSAPGFRDVILAAEGMTAQDIQSFDPNFVGGDISSGALTIGQMLKRPVLSPVPWRTPAKGVYLASSSTPPGTGVHGLSGYYAARSALRREFGIGAVPDLSANR